MLLSGHPDWYLSQNRALTERIAGYPIGASHRFAPSLLIGLIPYLSCPNPGHGVRCVWIAIGALLDLFGGERINGEHLRQGRSWCGCRGLVARVIGPQRALLLGGLLVLHARRMQSHDGRKRVRESCLLALLLTL